MSKYVILKIFVPDVGDEFNYDILDILLRTFVNAIMFLQHNNKFFN
jgi:hypothetical protein